jgi:hypothetical protein
MQIQAGRPYAIVVDALVTDRRLRALAPVDPQRPDGKWRFVERPMEPDIILSAGHVNPVCAVCPGVLCWSQAICGRCGTPANVPIPAAEPSPLRWGQLMDRTYRRVRCLTSVRWLELGDIYRQDDADYMRVAVMTMDGESLTRKLCELNVDAKELAYLAKHARVFDRSTSR